MKSRIKTLRKVIILISNSPRYEYRDDHLHKENYNRREQELVESKNLNPWFEEPSRPSDWETVYINRTTFMKKFVK